MNREEKLQIAKNLNWDYIELPETILGVIENTHISSVFTRDALFVRSLQSLPWNIFVEMWGVNSFLDLYTPENRRRLWPEEMRRKYDYVRSILRGESVSIPEWGSVNHERLQCPFLSNRWYSA